jgi:hypothetical protein
MRYCRQNQFAGAPIWCSCAISRQTRPLLQILFLASKRVPSLIGAGFKLPCPPIPPCFGTQNQGFHDHESLSLPQPTLPLDAPRRDVARLLVSPARQGSGNRPIRPAIRDSPVQNTSGCPSSRTRMCRLTPFCSASSRSQRGGSSKSSKDSLNVPKCIGTSHSAPRSRNTFNASSGPM